MVVAAPYDADFVAEIKSSLTSRRWDPRKKVWLIGIEERSQAIEVIGRFFRLSESSPPGRKTGGVAETPAGLTTASVTPDWLLGGDLEVWVDGACLGNPGPGGYAVVFSRGGERRAMSGGFRLTTNNRMEIMAAIAALEAIGRPRRLVIHSDSRYLVDAVEKGWARRWRSRNWMRTGTERAVNTDLWERLLDLCRRHEVKFRWVRGHDAQPENEWCDQLAKDAAARAGLPVDAGYDAASAK
jgi:ribonuclease HI